MHGRLLQLQVLIANVGCQAFQDYPIQSRLSLTDYFHRAVHLQKCKDFKLPILKIHLSRKYIKTRYMPGIARVIKSSLLTMAGSVVAIG